MRHTIIGAKGQIGSCVTRFFKSHDEEVFEVDLDTPPYEPQKTHMLHVCIRYTDTFVETVKKYQAIFNPIYTVVYSTVAPGTTEQLGIDAVHSPVEGRHPDLYGGFTTFDRFVSGPKAKSVGIMFSLLGLNVRTFPDTKITELGKILSTTRYGVNIMFAKVQDELCNQFGVNYTDVVTAYQNMYNKGYEKLGEKRFVQPTLTVPGPQIGGHCVVPNAQILEKFTDDEFVKKLAHFND
jgi:UDP-N-acetyl-D-mannosaminuronate dehydrogenase